MKTSIAELLYNAGYDADQISEGSALYAKLVKHLPIAEQAFVEGYGKFLRYWPAVIGFLLKEAKR